MYSKFTLLLLCLLMIDFTSEAQSIYFFQFKINDPIDTTGYSAFFFTNQDGTGTVRIRFTSAVSKEVENIDGQLKEEYLIDENGMNDPNNLIYRVQSPKIYPGKDKMPFKEISFLFSLNTQTNFLEPSKIMILTNSNEQLPTSTLSATLMEKKTINTKFVADFYKDYDPDSVYVTLFKKTRGLSAQDRNTRIHLILVANTVDKKIGDKGAKDIKKMEERFELITEYLGINPMIVTRITGDLFVKETINAAIDALKPKPNDIVVFYYTGHGYRKTGKDSIRPYPFLALTNKEFEKLEEYDRYSENLEDIFTRIKRKRARFNLVLSDCCNADYDAVVSILGLDPGKRSSGMDWSIENIARLFIKTRTSIIATAAGKNQLASTNPALGGFFTNYFLESMEAKFQKLEKNITWYEIFNTTKSKTIYKAAHTACIKKPLKVCEQYPFYNIERMGNFNFNQ